jgi:hypothetical protein
MTKRFDSWMGLTGLICAAVLLAGCGKSNVPTGGKPSESNPVLAEVNGKPITRSLFDLYLESLQRQTGRPIPPEHRDELLEQFISLRVAADAAEKSGVVNEQRTKDQLALARMNVLVDAYLQKYLAEHPGREDHQGTQRRWRLRPDRAAEIHG